MEIPTNRRFSSILGPYYCAAFLIYTASVLTFFWELQSLLLRFSLSDIVGFLSYQLAFALVESVLVAALVVLLVYLLPIKQVRDNRSVVGALFVFSFAINSLVFRTGADVVQWMYSTLPITQYVALQIMAFVWLFTGLGLPVLSIFLVRTKKLATYLGTWIENLSVLATLYTALGLIAVLVVLYRNLA